ncbi:hypothetical protein PBY51_005187 [Eleginops maclovinus]|uniref:Uncharacterized protein n=1 Tax=Eleginops maclovinus TaxID=56733 RepID=A0AAN7X503_ELEMC|nr:hypothetical protein PBY51_005187 [Eleginops maclovinus]
MRFLIDSCALIKTSNSTPPEEMHLSHEISGRKSENNVGLLKAQRRGYRDSNVRAGGQTVAADVGLHVKIMSVESRAALELQ